MNFSLTDILAIISPIISVAVSAGIINEKIKQLEKTVDKHNRFAERMPVLENRIDTIEYDVKELKKEIKGGE